jgi:hypothetical protein
VRDLKAVVLEQHAGLFGRVERRDRRVVLVQFMASSMPERPPRRSTRMTCSSAMGRSSRIISRLPGFQTSRVTTARNGFRTPPRSSA